MAFTPNGPDTGNDGVSAGQRVDSGRLATLARLIATSPHNLVSRSERASVLDVHIAEALAVAAELSPADGSRWLDLGTGGGLPGLVLALAFPNVSWALLDATEKKVVAVEQFARKLQLGNVECVAGRAEVLAHDRRYRGRFAGVVSRAVAPLPTLTELARGFLAPDGVLAAIKGPRWADELRAAGPAMRALRFAEAAGVVVDSAARPTWLVRMRAVGPPPAGFPRRTGIPKSQPLGAHVRD